MSRFLLDTNVISEIAGSRPDRGVVAFLGMLEDGWISVITQHELTFGLERLSPGPRRRALTEAIEGFLSHFGDRVLPVGQTEAHTSAALRAVQLGHGRVLHLADALIAATALCGGLTLATRNTADFQDLGVLLYDPWTTP